MKVKKLLPLLLPVALLGCTGAGQAPVTGERITLFDRDAPDVVIHSGFGSPRVRSWRVVDNSTLVIQVTGSPDLVATFMSPCHGIRFAETLGFATMGPFELDRTTTVILPDGRRCPLKELKPLVELEDQESAPEVDDQA